MDARVYWVWYSLACGQGSRIAVSLICSCGSAEKIYRMNRAALKEALAEGEMHRLNRLADKDLTRAQEIVRRCDEMGISILTPDDPAYPLAFCQLRDAPMVLYTLGRMPDLIGSFVCAVVGTRKMSDYGKKMSFDLGRGLGAGGAILVSGLALGCDGMAMAGALSAGGTTIGVLGCGLDIVYPPEHKELMKRVLDDGLIVSEYPPGTPPLARHFPVRNRLISAFCDSVVVVEGDLKSGSLITARHALYQGLEIYAVPGLVGESGSAGTNALLQSGARVALSALDLLKPYEFMYPHTIRVSGAVQELARSVSPEDAAARMNVSGASGKKYYGDGAYGGRRTSDDRPKKKAEGKKKAPPAARVQEKELIKRFADNAPPAPKMIEAKHVEFDALSDTEKKIYAALVPDVPTLADDIRLPGVGMSALLAGLTMLELCGAVECGAGGYYMRRSADEISELPAD